MNPLIINASLQKLLELNNIHSLKAVLAGLQSGPIFRLAQTWRLVAKRDKTTFERLCELLSADDNWWVVVWVVVSLADNTPYL